MKKKNLLRAAQISVVLLIVAAILIGIVAAPQAEAAGYYASYIEQLTDIAVDYTQYLDSSVVQQLPDDISDDQQISVIITLDQVNLMDAYEQTDKSMSFADYALSSKDATQLRSRIAREKAQILQSLDAQEISYTLGDNYDVVLCGFEMGITAGDFDAVCKSLDSGCGVMVCEVYNAAEAELVENTTNVYETGIINSSASGYDGSGMVVAVLDTGLDSSHSAFDAERFTSDKLGLTYDDVASVLSQTTAYKQGGGLGVDDVYINEKVPFGYDYADNDPDVYSTHNNHGTHVSGIIVGNDDTITGVAPNAQLVSMKIFSDVMDTAISSWILSALEDCVVLGVDVINMSLGTACGFSRESDEEILNGVYDKIREAGISVIVAASNSYSSAYGSEKNGNLGLTSNPDTGTVGSPGTYKGTMSIASISGTETPYMLYGDTIIYFDESTNGASKENNFFETLLGDEDSMTYEYVVIPGVGRTADYTGMDVTGKIVLVRRGDNTFEEKAMIAEAQGAAGIIIYNNVSGEIKMNVGDAKLAVCSITQDDGEMLVEKGSGKLKISKKQTSGPFISEFSSWGPTPSLEMKPDITSYGGNILSSVTGGGYDRLSGTSMACPNYAGITILLRQYVVENFPDIADDNVKVSAMVNCLLMSTADIALNTNGLPYAVRKQGAGLANMDNALDTSAYITTYDAEGNAMDKTKLELGDDPEKNGVYEMTFAVNNFGDKKLTYTIGGYVLTEGVSDTKTNAGQTTVTEEAYELEADIEVVSVEGGKLRGEKLTVAAGESATVTVKVALTDNDKQYLNESFANGMYVEGFITLENSKSKGVDLSVPYLAFYGDWTQAPMFDLTYYDTNADELDDAVPVEDKTMADAYATRPVGGISDDYVSYLGAYYFLQDPSDMIISANENYIALSNQEGTIHSLRFVWAGLLRSAAKIEISITDDTTGEVVFETEDTDVRKSYGDGGSIYPANIEIEFDTTEYNFANNSEYTVKLVGYMDYGEDGGLKTNANNVFEFPLMMDFEAPAVTNVSFTCEYDKTLKKNRLYANVEIYDNQYSMAAQLGYVANGTDEDGNEIPELKAFEQYMTPVYSTKNDTTKVQFELTDYIYEIKEGAINTNSFVVTCYDYALNYATYEIGLPTDYTDFYFDSLEEGLTLSLNEVYTFEPLIYPDSEWGELMEYSSSRPGVVRVVNNKLVAVSSGKATVRVRDPQNNKSMTFTVTVLGENDEGFQYYDKPVADIFRLTGYTTQKAYYMVDSNEKDIGDTGDKRFFEGNYNLSLYPSESVLLTYDLDAYFPNDTTVEFETSNESIVTINESGVVTAVAEGFASVTIKVMQDGRSTYYSESVSIEVKDPIVSSAGKLTHYYGNGGLVMIDEDLMLTEIGSFAFANFDYVLKTEEELAIDDREATKQWYIGEASITKIVLPEGIKTIGAYACANLTALEEIVLPSTLESIEYGAFYGCTSLAKITFSAENNLKIVNQNAFENCALESVDLSSVSMVSDYAFAGNTKLTSVTTGDALLSIGQYAFAGCEKLTEVTVTASKVKYGTYAFTGCKALESFYVNAAVLPEGMFYECEALTSVTVGPDVKDIGEFAFRDTAITSYEIASGNTAYKVQTADYILAADGTTLIAVSPTAEGAYTQTSCGGTQITAVAGGAFSHNTKLTSVELPNVTVVGDYAFGSSERLAAVTLGQLTKIGEYAFFETAITALPAFAEDVQIGKYAFAFTDITSVTIPDGMTVAEGVFSQCKNLQSVVIGNDVTLENYAFNMDKDESFVVESYEENGNKYFRYVFSSGLTSLTIGDNAVIGENVFAGHASLQAVTLGANAQLGKMAFYNCSSLEQIDLSKVKTVGDYAFSGDVYNVCLDSSMAYAAVSTEGTYIYTYHAPALLNVDLAAAESIGEYAFAYCRNMVSLSINETITELPQYTFAGCIALTQVNMPGVTTIGDYAFMECMALPYVDLSAVEAMGEYAFVYCLQLEKVTLNPNGCTIAEGAFSYGEKLAAVENMNAATDIGDYAFAYTAITSADLSGAVNIGMEAFLKETLTPFTVKLGESLETLGDNPFAMCKVEPFCIVETTDFNGTSLETKTYTYAISDTVQVINGSLYCQVPSGLELITYTGLDSENMKIAEDTVRITAMAFAGADVEMVTLPETVAAIGHKAFYACNKLHTVVFGSYESPIMEEEYDPAYYETFEHIPCTGDLGTYQDYNGNDVQINGMGLLPYYMWNATDGMYSNVFYGANFVDYVGYVETKLSMVRPVNGINYDNYIYRQYFDLDTVIDGAQAPDKTTMQTVAAIKAIPEKVSYEQRHLVEYARSLYTKIATTEQQALVTNYADLISAEQRIQALTPTDEPVPEAPEQTPEEKGNGGTIAAIVLSCMLGAAVLALAAYVFVKARKEQRPVKEVLTELWSKSKAWTVKTAKLVAAWCVKAGKQIAAWSVVLWGKTVVLAKKLAKLCTKAYTAAIAWIKARLAKKEKPIQTAEEAEEAEVSAEAAEEADQTEEIASEPQEEADDSEESTEE